MTGYRTVARQPNRGKPYLQPVRRSDDLPDHDLGGLPELRNLRLRGRLEASGVVPFSRG